MRGLGGLLLLAGIGVGLFVYFPAPVDRDTSLTHAARVSETRVAPTPRKSAATAPAPVRVSRLASFSPRTPLHLGPGQRGTNVVIAPAPTPAVKVEPANWQTNVVPAAGGVSGALEPTDPESRYKLVVDIQQQLKRVGCYPGRANGTWNNNTREAMREFTSRSNAALPVEKPDYMLLSMLKSHTGRSCGSTQTAAAQPVAQPRGKTQAVAAAPQPEVLPWKTAAAPQPATRLYTPMPTSVVSSEPLPGRMAIGGPKEFPAPQQEPLVPAQQGAAPGVATAALDPGATAPTAPPAPAATSKPRKKSGSWRRPSPGTPRYNLMLSLGGVY